MAKRTGIPSLLDVSKESCRLLSKYGPVITVLYSSNAALLAALAAAQAACAELAKQTALVREVEQYD